MQKLNLTKRPAVIGAQIIGRTQKHGKKEKVPAVTIPLAAILLTPDELGVLLNDPEAHESLFTAARSKFIEPRFLGIDDLVVSDKFKEAKVTIKPLNSTEAVILKPATIISISIRLMIGGAVEMTCAVSGVPDEHLQTLTLLNQKCTVSILNGSLAAKMDGQKDLPLEGGAGATDSDDDEDVASEGDEGEGDEGDDTTLQDAIDEEDDATRAVTGEPAEESAARRPRKSRSPR